MSIQRIDSGRGHWYKVDGRKADGVTTLIGDGIPKPALIGWAANTTAAYAVDHWDRLADMTVSQRLNELKRARFGDLDAASKRGTEVHGLAEKLAHGDEVEVPDEIAGHVESAVKFFDTWRPVTVMTETVVASRQWLYCGTFDYLADLPDGRRALLDWKTSRSGIYGEAAVQLGAYANAEIYLDGEGAERPVSDLRIDCGLAVWIRADGYDVYELDLTEGFQIFLHAAWLARRTRDMRDRLVSASLEAPVVA